MSSILSEQELLRREALLELTKLGIDAYPAQSYEINATASDINKNFSEGDQKYASISIAGRIMSRRVMGNASFIELQDSTGRVQVYLNRDELCPTEDKTLYNTVFKKL